MPSWQKPYPVPAGSNFLSEVRGPQLNPTAGGIASRYSTGQADVARSMTETRPRRLRFRRVVVDIPRREKHEATLINSDFCLNWQNGEQANISTYNLIAPIFRGLPKFAYAGDTSGFKRIVNLCYLAGICNCFTNAICQRSQVAYILRFLKYR